MTFATTAQALHDAFETRTRENGETFVRLAEGSPEWMRDAIDDAHGGLAGREPDDHIFAVCKGAAKELAAMHQGDYPDDVGMEFSGNLMKSVDPMAWLAAHPGNASCVDRAEAKGLIPSGQSDSERIACGMAEQAREIFFMIYFACGRKEASAA